MKEILSRAGVIPVIKITDEAKALPLADALTEGGLNVLEITFRTPVADKAISAVAKNRADVVVGAGTVLTVDLLKRAVDCGAKFIVSPGSNESVIDYACAHNIPVIPGVITPTEVENALGYGLTVLKFFPAESFGGVATLRSLSAPYSAVEWVPTGGINAGNLASYLSFNKVLACGASCMVTEELVARGDFSEITRLTKELVAIKKSLRG